MPPKYAHDPYGGLSTGGFVIAPPAHCTCASTVCSRFHPPVQVRRNGRVETHPSNFFEATVGREEFLSGRSRHQPVGECRHHARGQCHFGDQCRFLHLTTESMFQRDDQFFAPPALQPATATTTPAIIVTVPGFGGVAATAPPPPLPSAPPPPPIPHHERPPAPVPPRPPFMGPMTLGGPLPMQVRAHPIPTPVDFIPYHGGPVPFRLQRHPFGAQMGRLGRPTTHVMATALDEPPRPPVQFHHGPRGFRRHQSFDDVHFEPSTDEDGDNDLRRLDDDDDDDASHHRFGRGAHCIICIEPQSTHRNPTKEFVTCRRCNEPTCSRCLSRFVVENWTKGKTNTTASVEHPHVKCTACQNDYDDDVVGPVLDATALRMFMRVQRNLAEAAAFQEGHDVLEKTLKQLVETGKLAEMPALPTSLTEKALAKQLFDSYMCPRCDHGPIVHSGCDDLRMHHGEAAARGGGRVSNACPNCAFLPHSVSELKKWDGVSREGKAEMKASATSGGPSAAAASAAPGRARVDHPQGFMDHTLFAMLRQMPRGRANDPYAMPVAGGRRVDSPRPTWGSGLGGATPIDLFAHRVPPPPHRAYVPPLHRQQQRQHVNVQALVDMGFSRDESERVMRNADDPTDVEGLVEQLLQGAV